MEDSLFLEVHPALKPYIRALYVDDFAEGSSIVPAAYPVLPGSSIVAGFQYRGRLGVRRDGREQLLDISGVTGLQTTARVFVPRAETRTLLVIFESYGAFPFLGCPMNEIAEQHVGLDALLATRPVRLVSDRLAEARSSVERADIVQSFFLSLLERTRQRPHPLVVEAVRRISQGHGRDAVEGIARDLRVSRRHLERLFQRQIGVGPKEFASLLRFEWVRKHLPRRRSWAALAYEAGFADQAHFVRHFAARTGSTPEEYARRLSSP